MNEENSYEALYLYNAVIEYAYFVIALIEVEGPRSLIDIEKHLKFFNHDIYGFAEMFKGEALSEKIGSMLCTTTQIFNVQGKILSLSLNYNHFKQIIYKDLLMSKLIDCILRGFYHIKDICHNLNLNNMIRINEKSLTVILKKYPFFYLDSNDAVILVQFHGLLGFEDHAYKTVVLYFQSYLQNINSLTCNEVIFHEKLIPSCAITNPLFLFCVLHVCSIFKSKNGKVKLRKRFRTKKCSNQTINIEEMNINPSESVPIGLLISKALGRTLYCCTGEISEVKKSTGLIQCVVNFTNGYQGIFVIYMYKTALKHVCEIENLNDYLSIRDIVEFDAIYSDEGVNQGIYWQATRIKVIKQSLKKNKLELNISAEKYFEKIKFNLNLFNTTSKTCSLRSCNANFSILQKKLKVSPLKRSNVNPSSDFDTNPSKVQMTVLKKSSNLCLASHDCLTKKATTTSEQFLPVRNNKAESLCDINLSAGKTDSNKNIAHFPAISFMHSLFVFGEVSITSDDDGMAITLNRLDQINVFFKSEAVFSQNTKKIPAKGSKVLLFIPYFKSEDSFCVATLVYPLNSEECILLKQNISIEIFVMNNFLSTVIKNLKGAYPCFCSLKHTFSQILHLSQKIERKRENLCKCVKFIENLLEPFCLSEKTVTIMYALVKELHSQNMGSNYTRLCFNLATIFVKALSFIGCSKKFTVLKKRRKNNLIYNYIKKRTHSSLHFMHYLKTACSKMPDIVTSSFNNENKYLFTRSDNEKGNLIESKDTCLIEKPVIELNNLLPIEQNRESCNSVGSSKSYNSKSSDDLYYSCESLPEVFDSKCDKNGNSMQNEIYNAHLHEENNSNDASSDSNKIEHSLLMAEKSSEPSKKAIDIPEIKLNSLSKKNLKISILNDPSNFKLSHSALSKAKYRRYKRRIILPSTSNHCKKCCVSVIETTAVLSTITNSCLHFCTEYNQQIATLRFPKYLVSKEILPNLSLESTIKIGIIPSVLLHFSDVMYTNLH